MRRSLFCLVAALALAVACESTNDKTDLGTDVPADTATDTATDPGTDTTPDVAVDTTVDAATDTSADVEPLPPITVVNFNAGLATGYVDYAPQRLPLIGPAIAALEADVVCLEETWADEDAQALVTATASAFPNAYREATTDEAGTGGPACTADEIGPLQTCALANCAEEPPENLATCVLGNCGDEFGAVSDGCQTCLVSQIGQPLDTMVTTCTTSAGGTYAYEGRNGVLLLSKYPLGTKEMLRMDSYLNVRVVLHAVVKHPQWGDVDVFCTHLTADLSDVDYGGEFGSWGAEQGKQVDAMLAWVDQKKVGEVIVLAGDMNCGPANDAANIEAAHEENYQKFADAGFADPYFVAQKDTCTWCSDNPLVTDGINMIIDHVFLKNAANASAKRVLDRLVTLQSTPAVDSRLSDHYGVSVTFNAPLP
jgi:endonuclease/exonuclease/phosphatase family metal-dependent hydrolase